MIWVFSREGPQVFVHFLLEVADDDGGQGLDHEADAEAAHGVGADLLETAGGTRIDDDEEERRKHEDEHRRGGSSCRRNRRRTSC